MTKHNQPPRIPDAACAPLSAGVLMLAVGLFGLAAHQPLLFPSLGLAAALQVETPDQASARPQISVAGHLIGLLAGALPASGCLARQTRPASCPRTS
ncbi:hypothetical protein LAJ19_14330 (plasmid) [Deinococcus taeanensis]|uniref:HPP family protein n=1 Tax=Deinococcus taeanensis TaxID=2737050 RepID=UPI001CDC7372|nr:hypothetical protein [Deinococcus taeanensis]UBV44341.1 hypothetical protein LAJ19_14330 [Deinococcus taeanensis]